MSPILVIRPDDVVSEVSIFTTRLNTEESRCITTRHSPEIKHHFLSIRRSKALVLEVRLLNFSSDSITSTDEGKALAGVTVV